MSRHAKFQPSSYKTVGGDSCDRGTCIIGPIPTEIFILAPGFAREGSIELIVKSLNS